MIETKKVGLIVSGGRTGTQFFGERLQQAVEDCTSFHEPDTLTLQSGELRRNLAKLSRFGAYHMLAGKLLGRTGIKNVNRRYLQGRIGTEQAAREIERYRRPLYESCNSSLVVESNYGFFGLIPVIPHAIADYRVAIVVRDPRVWIQSYIQKGVMYGRRDWLTPLGIGKIRPRQIGMQEPRGGWGRLDLVGRVAWNWFATYGILWSTANADERASWFRFEDLFGEASSDMERKRLLRWLSEFGGSRYRYSVESLDIGQQVNESRKSGDLDWRNWSNEQVEIVDELCGELMRSFGYGDEPEWKARLGGSPAQGGRQW